MGDDTLERNPRQEGRVKKPHTLTDRSLPSASLKKAAKAFKDFNLSRFAADSQPRNYVPTHAAKDTAAVQALHRELITQQLRTLPTVDPANPGMTLALPEAQLKKLLPSYKPDSGAIDLSEMLAVLRQRMNGTDFYTNGAPPLIQSAEQSRLQTTVKGIIQSIKKQGATE